VLASISTKTVQQAHFIACKGTKIFTNHQISVLFLLKFHDFLLEKLINVMLYLCGMSSQMKNNLAHYVESRSGNYVVSIDPR
jgi:hypothetical protein